MKDYFLQPSNNADYVGLFLGIDNHSYIFEISQAAVVFGDDCFILPYVFNKVKRLPWPIRWR